MATTKNKNNSSTTAAGASATNNNNKPKIKVPVKKKASSSKPAFWQSTPFLCAAFAIALSVLLTQEPVVRELEELFGTNGALSRVLLQQDEDGSTTTSSSTWMNEQADQWCEEHPGTCAPAAPGQEFTVTVINKSEYRTDIHLQDKPNSLGQNVAILEPNSQVPLAVKGHSKYFLTRHGVKERLVDPNTDKPLEFFTTQMGHTFTIPSHAAPSTNKCQDRYDVCPQYAKAGECWERLGWMVVHCCQSCQQYSTLDAAKLIDPNVRCSKENMNITDPAWQPGDLDQLFRQWATDPAYQKYEPQVLSSPDDNDNAPWVMTFDHFFTEQEAQALIDGGTMAGFDRSTNQGKINAATGEMEMVTSTTRTSSNAWCVDACQQLPDVQTVTQRIETVTGIPSKNYEPFQVLEYQDHQFYKMHHDSEGRDTKPPGNRILTFFLYLSDVEEGGETKFNHLGIQVKPKLGRALVWPSVRNDEPDFWDDRMYHEAMPVLRGKKYAANHWIHLNDYEGPNRWGCTGSFK